MASYYDVLWINLDDKEEIDIDNELKVGSIKRIYNFEEKFYILANSLENRMGIYLIEFDEENPTKKKPVYLISKKLNSDIDNANLKLITHK